MVGTTGEITAEITAGIMVETTAGIMDLATTGTTALGTMDSEIPDSEQIGSFRIPIKSRQEFAIRLWRAGGLSLGTARITILEYGEMSSNYFFAMHIPTKEIVARANRRNAANSSV